MNYKDFNHIVDEHFSSFGRLSVENRKVSIVQSTRLILSIIRYNIKQEDLGKLDEEQKDSVDELFLTLDTSLNYIISKDAIIDNYHTELDMRSDIPDEPPQPIQHADDGNDKREDNPIGKDDFKVGDKTRGKEQQSDDESQDSDEDSSSLNSIYSVSLNDKKGDTSSNVVNTVKGADGIKEIKDENDEIFDEKHEEEDLVKELFSKDKYPYSLDSVHRIKDQKFHSLLESLSKVGIFTHVPYKLYRILRHHATFFKSRKDIITCSVYSLVIEQGYIDIIAEFFGL